MIHELLIVGSLTALIMCVIFLVTARMQISRQIVALREKPTRVIRSNLDRLLSDAGVPDQINANAFRLGQIGATVLLAALGWFALGLVFAIAGAGAGYFVPVFALRYRRSRRQRRLENDLNYVLQHMQSLLRAGSTLDRVIQQIAYRNTRHSVYEKIFQQMAEDIRISGGSKTYAFDRAQMAVNNPIFDRFIGYLRVNEELGVELTPLLKLAQDQIRAQTTMMNKLNAAATQTKMSSYFIPIFLGGALLLVQILEGPHSYWGPLFTFPGNLIELFAYGMFFAGGWVISKLQALPPTHRMFYRKHGTVEGAQP